MYTRRTDTKASLITPESTPVKQNYTLIRTSSGASASSPNISTQRRLPRKPVHSPPSLPEPPQPQEKHRLDHPVDFIIYVIFQSLYHHFHVNLAAIAQEELRSPILGISMVATSLAIFMVHLARIIGVGLGLGLCATKALLNFVTQVFTPMACSASTCLMELVQHLWAVNWIEVMQLCWIALRDHVRLLPSPPSNVGSTGCIESLSSACSSPSSGEKACPPSPLPSRKPRHAAPSLSPYPRAMTPQRVTVRTTGNTPKSILGHRLEDLHRILADCSEVQLEAAGRLVYVLQAQAQARAGWKL